MWTNTYSTEDIGQHIAAMRKAAGHSQAEFAVLLGVHRSTLSSLENGAAVSSMLLVNAIAALGSRVVILPKSAAVAVTEAASETVTGAVAPDARG